MRSSLAPALFSLLSAVFPAMIRAQDGAPPPVAYRGALQGVVVNAVSGVPIRRAQISVSDAESRAGRNEPISAYTDANGRFAFHNLAPGDYQLWAELPGFESQYYGAQTPQLPGDTVTLAEGQEISNLSLKMVPRGAISGRVLDEGGEPLQGANVQALHLSSSHGRHQLRSVGWATSDDRGEYRIYNLPAGRYYLSATCGGSASRPPYRTSEFTPARIDSVFAPAFYPGALEFARASVLPLAAGSELREIDIRVPVARTAVIRGQITLPVDAGSAGPPQLLLAYRDGGGLTGQTGLSVNGASGRFEMFGIPPGSYMLIASAAGQGRRYYGRREIEVTDGDLDNINLALSPAVTLAGQVTVEGLSAAKSNPPRVWLSARDNLPTPAPPPAVLSPDLSFHIDNIPSGDWIVEVGSLPDDSYVKSVQLGTRQLAGDEMSIDSDPGQPLRILISPTGAQLTGTVPVGASRRRPVIVLVPQGDREGVGVYTKTATPDEQGRFTIRGIAPGAYKIFAFEEVAPTLYHDPDFLRMMDSYSQSVQVSDSDRVSSSPGVIPATAVLAQTLSGSL